MKLKTQRLNRVLALVLTIVALLAGQQAMAESKTVTYKMQAEITYGSGGTTGCKLTFVPFGDSFGYSTGQKIAIISNIQSTSGFGVELDDGLRLQFRFNSGSKVTFTNKDGYHGIMLNYQADQNTYITVSSINYYVTHIKMANLNGDAIGGLATPWMTSTGALDQDVTMVPDGHTPTTYNTFIAHVTGTQIFAQLTVTYSDAPAIGVFEAAGENTYNIKDKYDLRHLADYVNNGKNTCSGLTFLQTQDITCDDTYVPIGYHKSDSDRARFGGTYNGQGYTVSGITVNRTGDNTSANGYIGLFGNVNEGTVENVILANSTFTGSIKIGGIVGKNSGGTVQNCRVESTVTINAGYNNAMYHGGIVGDNFDGTAKVIGCYSAASIKNNGNSNHKLCGGIAGDNYGGTIKDCLYTGATIEAADTKGGILGYEDGNPAYTNNYYTSVSIGGVGAEGSSSDQDGARRARTVTLGENVALVGNETAYSVSGLTAIGTGNYALKSGSTIYSGEGQTLTFSYTGEEPAEGYQVTWSTTAGTIEGSTLTMPNEDVTITATVVPITYTVHFDANGGSGEMDDQTFTYGEAQNLTACAFSYAGENFLGWSTQANGRGTSYSDGEEVINLTTTDGATITLYAQWDHDWGLPVWNWAADCSSATAVFTCANCGDIQSVTANENDPNSTNFCMKLATGENYYACVDFKWHRYEDLYGPDVLGPGQHRVDLRRPYYMICPSWDYMAYHITSSELDLYIITELDLDDEELNTLVFFDSIRSNSWTRGRDETTDFEGNFDFFVYSAYLASVAFVKDDGSEGQIDVNIKPVLYHRYSIEQTIPDATLSARPKHEIKGYTTRGLIFEDDIVWLTCTPDDAQADMHVLWSVTDADGQSIPVRYHEGKPYFVMPAKNVTIRTLDTLPWEGEGTGTEDDPYQISNYAELKQFANIVNGTGGEAYTYASAKLVNDIVCKNSFEDTEFATDWVPIGNASHPYIGTFDGQGHTITGLSTPTDNTSDYVGLFGYIGSYGVVKDVILEYATMTGNSNVGVVAGYNDGTLTDNYYISCSANDATADIGTGSGDCDGARGLFTITLPEGATASTATVTLDYTDYFAAGTTVTLSYSGTPPEGFADPVVYSLNGTTIDSNTFAMPAEDVTVSARWAVPYIDADGSTKYCRDYTVIDPSKNGYGNKDSENWYVVCGTVNMMTYLNFAGSAHVILCDGASLTLSGYEGQIEALRSLTIYGQSEGTGSITVNSEYDEEIDYSGIGIKARDFTLCGGNITLTGDICGLYARDYLTVHRGSINATGSYTGPYVVTFGDCGGAGICSEFITINGGTVVGTGGNIGIYQDRALDGRDFTINGGSVSGTGTNYAGIMSYSSIIINGGQVSASGGSVGLYSDYNNIILGCSSASDYITATSFDADEDILVKDGQTLTDGTNTYSGTLTTEQIDAIAGKTLRLATYSYALTANEHDGNYWTTFYSSEAGFKINDDENACAYTATYSSETLTLHKLGRVIPAGTAVVIVGEDNSIGLTASSEAAEYTVDNKLRGVDVRTLRTELGTGTVYVMGKGKQNGNFGFFQYTADYMPAHKAYLLVSGGEALVNGFQMEFEDDATSLNEELRMKSEEFAAAREWYTLDGRKLNGKPSQRGIYIHNGRREVLK